MSLRVGMGGLRVPPVDLGLPTRVALLSLKYTNCEMLTSSLYLLIKMIALKEI